MRGGLEAERDALPGLLAAIGHEPVRFEDFTAQPEPSRQACMDGVDGSDVYVLLLGPRYGHRFPDSGQSPTHDEYIRARTRGIPKLVFLKEGDTPEPDQAKLIAEIRDYAAGSFYDTFTGVGDLLPKVATALTDLASRPSALTWEPLAESPRFTWRSDWRDQRQGNNRDEPTLELHTLPVQPRPIPSRVLADSGQQLINTLRQTGTLPAHAGVEVKTGDSEVIVDVTAAQHYRYDEPRSRQLRGVRIDRNSQMSVWWSLPGDGMGGILNEDDLLEAYTTYLRWIGATGPEAELRYAVATGATGFMINIVEGQLSNQSRNRASFGSMSDEPVRVLPDESVSAAAFDAGAPEVGRDLTNKILRTFRNRR